MKKNLFGMAAVVVALGATAGPASSQEVLEGDTRLACEAILCLSTGQRPDECTPSLNRYFGIKKKKLSDTLEARLDFLEKCPESNRTPQMSGLVRAISRGAGRCDAASLNSTLYMWAGGIDSEVQISNRLPEYCAAYTSHAYTDFNATKPIYVGTPEKGGYWVEAKEYERAQAEYNARLEAERRDYWWGGS